MRADELLSVLRPSIDAGIAPGAIVGVRHHGETSVEAVGGTGASGDPLPVDAVVRISSNTKPLIAALTLLLAQENLLALDDPIARFLSELADQPVLRRIDASPEETEPARRPPTVEDLLTMRLGFGWVFESDCAVVDRASELGLGFGPPDPPALPAPDEWIARFATLPLLEQPGSSWRYELSFAVLGVLIERAAGQPLGVTLSERLLAPLGMVDTAFATRSDRLVPAFARSEHGLVLFDGVDDSRWREEPRFADGRGGLVSTAEDLLRFAGMLLDRGGGLLEPENVLTMTSDQLTPEQRAGPSASTFLNSGGWGYGVGVSETVAGTRYGWGGGLGSLWYSWPEHELAAVLITQVLPPSSEMFDPFTAAIEQALSGQVL